MSAANTTSAQGAPHKRNVAISIAKGIAIILMVIGHAEAPEMVTNFIYTFHMPLFFIASGYFFSEAAAADPWRFCEKRFKGLYIPFLKWSIFFLLLHNVLFHFGILNEQYGNWTGGVTHPYTLHQVWQRLVLIVTSMSGYDEFIAGAFWFFRGLMVASILYLVFFRLLNTKLHISPSRAAFMIALGAVAFCAFHILSHTKLTYYPNGFWRETWGIFFFALGFLFKRYEAKIPSGAFLTAAYFILLCIAAKMHFSGMNNSGRLRDLWTLPITGSIGFLMVYQISRQIAMRGSWIRSLLTFIGDNTLYVFIFHIISFKVVSLMKIRWYDLDPAQIGCHMVIHYNNTDFFWVLYSIAGVALPLIGLQLCRRWKDSLKPHVAPLRSRIAAIIPRRSAT